MDSNQIGMINQEYSYIRVFNGEKIVSETLIQLKKIILLFNKRLKIRPPYPSLIDLVTIKANTLYLKSSDVV